jgi:hypothetical protein
MAFDREKFEKLRRDRGVAVTEARKTRGGWKDVTVYYFKTEADLRRAMKECGGELKEVQPRVTERVDGEVVSTGRVGACITKVEAMQILDERRTKQPFQHKFHEKQNVTVNGPHEFLEYVPIAPE